MPFDYSNAPPPRDLELIPDGTVATINTHLRPGGAGGRPAQAQQGW